jgi:hypothetical protein
METKEYKSDFWDRVEARAEARGEARGEAKAVVKVLEARAIGLTSEQRDRVLSCADIDQLDRWIDRAVTATSAEDVFKD